jgi:hypothetical protein
MSKAGRSRIEIPQTNTFKQLKAEIAGRVGVDAAALQLFSDQQMRKEVKGRDGEQLVKLGLKNGDMIHVGNQDTTMTHLPPAPKKFVPLPDEKKEGNKDQEMKEEKN